MSVACACRADGRNCGSGWRARKACSQAYSEMHTQDTYDNAWSRASDMLMLDQGIDIHAYQLAPVICDPGYSFSYRDILSYFAKTSQDVEHRMHGAYGIAILHHGFLREEFHQDLDVMFTW
jgi:hypothetical protein